jgi:hypothetical protein
MANEQSKNPNMLEAMRAKELKAFKAGWDACYIRHSKNVLIQASGFPEAWSKYVDQQEQRK